MQQEQNEITFIDLLVVVIKHRRLILVSTALSMLVSGIVFFGLPLFGLVSFRTYTVTATAIPVQIPPALKNELGIDLYALASAYAQEIAIVSEGITKNKLARNILGDPEGLLFRTYIARSFLGKQYSVKQIGDVLVFKVIVKDADAGKAFLTEMISYAEGRVRQELWTRSMIIAESMESLYKDAAASTVLSDSVKQLIISSKPYAENKVPTLIVSGNIDILVDAQGRGKNAVFIVMGVLFFSVFMAFILEYIERIQHDPDASEKIKKAFGK